MGTGGRRVVPAGSAGTKEIESDDTDTGRDCETRRRWLVWTGHDTTVVSQVDTEYAPCACSPLGKMWRVSQPYAPGGTPVWTTYTYDGGGRTLTVTLPDGSVTRTEYLTVYWSYTGSLVRVTDAAGKWKIQQTDGLGQFVRVIEPDPDGGADWITNYTYDALGHLVGVSMPRSNGTHTRTFVYTGNGLTSATNPENGTVTYQYDGSHHVTKRTDAKGQETTILHELGHADWDLAEGPSSCMADVPAPWPTSEHG